MWGFVFEVKGIRFLKICGFGCVYPSAYRRILGSGNLRIVLTKRRSANGYLVTIYADSVGRVEAMISKNGIEATALVKGINQQIDISNEKFISSLIDTLQRDCYLTVSRGDVHVNVRIRGGGEDGFIGFMGGVLQVGVGVALTVGTGGAGALLGSTLIGSGMSGAMYSLTTEEENLKGSDYFKQSVIGGATGLVSGLGSIASSGAGLIGKGLGSAFTGAAGRITSATTEAFCYQKDVKLSFSDITSGAASGVTGSVIGGTFSSMANPLTDGADDALEQIILKGLYSGLGGATSGAGAQMVSNLVQKNPIEKDVGRAALSGGVIGTVTCIAQGSLTPTKVERKEPPLVVRKEPGKSFILGNMDEQKPSTRVTREHAKIWADHRTVNVATGRPFTSEQIKISTSPEMKSSKNPSSSPKSTKSSQCFSTEKSATFFSDKSKQSKLFTKLGVSENQNEYVTFLQDIEEKAHTDRFGNEIQDTLSKQFGHIKEQKGVELSDPRRIKGPGRIIASSGGGTIKLGSKSSGMLTKLEGNYVDNSIKYKLYSHMDALAETTDFKKQACLQKVIKQEFQAYKDYGEFLKNIGNETALKRLAQNVATRIAKLPEGGSYLVCSGFEGHATCHRFEMKKGEIITTIYNGGDGLEWHTEAGNSSVYPFGFEGIPKPKIINTLNKYISDVLINQTRPKSDAINAIYAPSLLKKAANQTVNSPMPEQKVGNCSWHNFTEAVKPDLGDFNQEMLEHEIKTCESLKVKAQQKPKVNNSIKKGEQATAYSINRPLGKETKGHDFTIDYYQAKLEQRSQKRKVSELSPERKKQENENQSHYPSNKRHCFFRQPSKAPTDNSPNQLNTPKIN